MDSSYNNRVKRNSFVISAALASNYIAVAINSLLPVAILPIMSMVTFLYTIAQNRRINLKTLSYLFLLSIMPLATVLIFKDSTSTTYVLYFVQALLFASCVKLEFKFKYVISGLIKIYAVLFWVMLFHNKATNVGGDLMGFSYAILPGILAALFCIMEPHKDDFKKNEKILSLGVLIYYVFMSLMYISRGVVLSIACYMLLLIIYRNRTRKDSLKKIVVYVLLFIFLCVALLQMGAVLKSIQTLLNQFGISVPFINENINRLAANTILDGRENIAAKSIALFKMRPFFGNGIGACMRAYNFKYDHNLFLQMLSEGGIMYLLLNVIPLLNLVKVVKNHNKSISNHEQYLLVCFLLCVSIVRLLFSYMFWREQGYWMLIMMGVFAIGKSYCNIDIQENN